MSRVLVTGGGGFIGTHLVRRLVERGDDVVVVDRFEAQVHGPRWGEASQPLRKLGARVWCADAGDKQLLRRALAGVDRVIHLASVVGVGQSMYEIARYVERNTLATAQMLEVLVEHRPRRLVVASSMSIYGEGEYGCDGHGYQTIAPRPRPEAQLLAREWELKCPRCAAALRPVATRETKALLPSSVYAITKRDHEELCLVAGAAYGIPTVALRFFNVYGPGQALSNPYTGAAAIFASRYLNGEQPVIFEDGLQTRDFVHVDDLVSGIVAALDSDVDGEAINLGTGVPVTVWALARTLAHELGAPPVFNVNGQYRAGDIRHCFADVTKARRLLGFEANVRLAEGMRELAGWLRDQKPHDQVDQALGELRRRGLAR